MKFVITAYRHVGKTTLVNKVLASTTKNVCGFFTDKIGDKPNEEGLFPVYIFPAGEQPILDDEHLVGLCGCGNHYTNFEVFDTLGVEYLTAPDNDTLIVMDEVGFMELGAEKYKAKIFEVLGSENPVLLMLKDRMDVEHIRQIRDYPGVTFIEMNEENRDEVCERVVNEFR